MGPQDSDDSCSFLGFIGVVVSFLTLYIGLDVFHLDHVTILSFVYLKLSVAGHLVLLAARTKGPFWSVRPARSLLIAVIATQAIATALVSFGILLPQLGLQYVAFIWVEMLIVFVITHSEGEALQPSYWKGRSGKGHLFAE